MRHTTECPVCGDGETNQYRMYTKKPKKWGDRNKFTTHYDYHYDYCNI